MTGLHLSLRGFQGSMVLTVQLELNRLLVVVDMVFNSNPGPDNHPFHRWVVQYVPAI
jgi:hypothetical protein